MIIATQHSHNPLPVDVWQFALRPDSLARLPSQAPRRSSTDPGALPEFFCQTALRGSAMLTAVLQAVADRPRMVVHEVEGARVRSCVHKGDRWSERREEVVMCRARPARTTLPYISIANSLHTPSRPPYAMTDAAKTSSRKTSIF